MRLAILAHGPMLEGRHIDRDAPNPGIGGTQFTRLRLAQAFAERFPKHRVEVVSDHHLTLSPPQPNLRFTLGVRFDDYLADLSAADDDWVLTGPSMLLRRVDPRVLRGVAPRTIITSHLMYDVDLWEAERQARFAAAACVGTHHFHASRSQSPRVHLRDLFLPGWPPPDDPGGGSEAPPPRTRSDDGFRIVHVGALLPLKGFHDLARLWPDISTAIPGARLDVIGGSDVYGRPGDHPMLPTGRAFGDEILRHIPVDDVRTGRVVFHGSLGPEKVAVIRDAEVAVLNVAGREESLCAALIECLDLGTPVVGSARHGLWDSMHHLPEVATRRPSEVVERLRMLAGDRDLLATLSARSVRVAAGFRAENAAIIERWEAVAGAVLRGERPPSFAPTERARPAWIDGADHLRRRARYEASASVVGEPARRIKRVVRRLVGRE